jgi:tRNA A37 threonylcarbamoyladenosine dehydratase
MNISKHAGFFDPLTMIKSDIHIIGCGAVGSTVAEMLTRMGITELHLYDFDDVEPITLPTKCFTQDR